MKIIDPDTIEETAALWVRKGLEREAAHIRKFGISFAGGGRPTAEMTQDEKLAIGYGHFIEKWHAYWRWEDAVKYACSKIDMSTMRKVKKGTIEITDGFTNLQEMIAGRRSRAKKLLEEGVWVLPKYANTTKTR